MTACSAAGVCVRLYSLSVYQDEMSECRRPAVMETNLSHLVLLLKRLDIADMGQYKFLDRPGEHSLSLSLTSHHPPQCSRRCLCVNDEIETVCVSVSVHSS